MEDYKAAIDAAFSAKANRAVQAKKAKEAAEAQKNEFLQSYKHLENSIVMPVFEEFGRYYQRDQHTYRIDWSGESKLQKADPGSWVRLVLTRTILRDFGSVTSPFFEVRANADRQIVEFFECSSITDADKRHCGEARVDSIDASTLQSHLVRLVKEILK